MQNILSLKVKQNYIQSSGDYEQSFESSVRYEKLSSLCKTFPCLVICSSAGYQIPLVFPIIIAITSHQIPKYYLENHTALVNFPALEDINLLFTWKNTTFLNNYRAKNVY